MRDVDPNEMRELESKVRVIGKLIGSQCGPGQGFALMMFSFEGPEFTWFSNAQRGDMVKAMQEFIRRNPPDQTSEARN